MEASELRRTALRRCGWVALIFVTTAWVATTFAAVAPSARPTSKPSTTPATTQPASRPTTAAVLLSHLAPSTEPAHREEPPEGVPLGDVATEGEKVSQNLGDIDADLDTNHGVADIADELPVLSSEISARADETTRLLASSPTLQTLRSQQQAWDDLNTKLVEWKRQIDGRINQLKADSAQLSGQNVPGEKENGRIAGPSAHRWQVTLGFAASLPQNDNLQSIEQHIEGTLDSIHAVALHVQGAQRHIYTLSVQVDDLLARVLVEQRRVKSASDEAFNRLLTRDNVPIWTLLRQWRHSTLDVVGESQNSFWTQVRGLSAYADRESPRFVLHAVVLLLLTALLQYGRHRIQQALLHDPLLSAATPVFRTPLLTSIVLTFFISIWIYPEAPRLLWAIIGAAALIPTVMILQQLVEKRLLTILYAMVAFYFVDQLRIVAASQFLISRLIFLAETAAASVFLASFLLSTHERAEEAALHGAGDRLWRTMRWGVRVAGLLFAAAFLANTVGFVSLSSLVGDATLGSAYVAIILFAAVRLIDGLLLIALRCRPLIYLTVVRRNEPLLRARLSALLRWAGGLFWGYLALQLFWLWNPVYGLAHDTLFDPIKIAALPPFTLHDVTVFVITVWASFLISRLIRFVLDEDIYGRFGVPGGTTYAINRILHYAILVAGFYLAIGASGVPTGHFVILASAFGVGLGFGLQNIVNNFVSGLILLFERPIKVGDLVQIGDSTGIVAHIGIRASVIRTADSSEVIVPNGNLISANVTNWTLSNRQRGVDIPVAVAAANTDPAAVIDLLQKTAAAYPGITTAPPPKALLISFTGDAYQFRLRAFTNQAERWNEVSSDLSLAINTALKAANVALK